jgi:hypothetical protein
MMTVGAEAGARKDLNMMGNESLEGDGKSTYEPGRRFAKASA